MDGVRVGWTALLATLAVGGLALGAALQFEAHLPPDVETQLENNERAGPGNPIPLTGLLVAAAGAGFLALLSRKPSTQRILPTFVAFLSLYLLTIFVQTAWPDLRGVALQGVRAGALSITLIVSNGTGIPSVHVPLFGTLAGLLLATLWAARTLLGRDRPRSLSGLVREQAARHTLSAPITAVAVAGTLRLVGEIPDGQPLARILLPALAAALVAVEGVGLAKLWQLARTAQDGRWSPVAREAWQGLARLEWALCGAVALLVLAASFLDRLPLESLRPSHAFGVTLQSHTQFVLLALVPALPRLADGGRALVALKEAPPLAHASGPHPLAIVTAAMAGISLVLASLGCWLLPGALAPWLLAFLPATGLALSLGGSASAIALAVTAFASWAFGNDLAATFVASEGSELRDTSSALLVSLARLVGLTLAAAAVARLTRRLGQDERPSIAIPLSALAGVATGLVGLLLLAFDIWVLSTFRGHSVALGSLLASQDTPVQVAMALLAMTLGLAAGLALARLGRPEWFGRPPPRPLAHISNRPTAS
ncbi:MAG: hypothetical protein AABX89_00235 [Candidatus Thermoplasmatota archaeon]